MLHIYMSGFCNLDTKCIVAKLFCRRIFEISKIPERLNFFMPDMFSGANYVVCETVVIMRESSGTEADSAWCL